MIAEALEYFAGIANASREAKVVVSRRDVDTVLLPNGATVDYDNDFPSRSHGVKTLADLTSLANRFGEKDGAPVVWYDEDSIVLVINDETHRNDTVEMKLVKSGLYKAIESLDPRVWHQPKEFIRLLRIDLFGALDPQTLLQSVRKVQFDAGASTKVENTRVRESMGKEISASVSAASELPEYVNLVTPMFTNSGVETIVTIKAAVEVDPNRQAFQLVVLPDELDKAKAHVMRAVAAYLDDGLESAIPSYYGRPVV